MQYFLIGSSPLPQDVDFILDILIWKSTYIDLLEPTCRCMEHGSLERQKGLIQWDTFGWCHL